MKSLGNMVVVTSITDHMDLPARQVNLSPGKAKAAGLFEADCQSSHPMRLLNRAAPTISNPHRKLVVSRDLGPDTMALLRAREDLEV